MEIFAGVHLREGEKVVAVSKTTKIGLILTWMSIPGFYFVLWLITYVPVAVKTAVSASFRQTIMQELGVSDWGQVNLFAYVFGQIHIEIPRFIFVLLGVSAGMLILIWLACCLVMTWRHFRYNLAITDLRVIGRAQGEILDSPLNEIVNVYIERSIWGRLLGYSAITVQTKRKSLTVKNIKDPKSIFDLLMSYASEYCAH